MYEVLILKCACGNASVSSNRQIDLAEFLRSAIKIGWRQLEEGPISVEDGVIEINIAGQCKLCSNVVRAMLARKVQ